MASTRMEKNKKIHEDLKEEEKLQRESKAFEYEKKISKLDPSLNKDNVDADEEDLEHILDEFDDENENDEESFLEEKEETKVVEAKQSKIERPILEEKEETQEDEEEIEEEEEATEPFEEMDEENLDIPMEKPNLNYEYSSEIFDSNAEIKDQPLSFTDKISVEELLRKRVEEQEKLVEKKKNKKRRSPTNGEYTPEVMQERIKVLDGVDIRKDLKNKSYLNGAGTNSSLVTKILIYFLLGLIIIGSAFIVYLLLQR